MKEIASEAELAYCAGVVDSDGTIGVKRGNFGVGKDCTQPSYGERITVKQVESHAVDLLHRVFGGAYRVEKASLINGRPLHTWQVTHLKAVATAEMLLPYLRIKRAQAENLLTFPRALVEPCILAGCRPGGVVLDPFFGSGTTGQVAQALGRQFICIELNASNDALQADRLRQPGLLLEVA